MVVTRSQSGAEENQPPKVFSDPPRSPSAAATSQPPTGGRADPPQTASKPKPGASKTPAPSGVPVARKKAISIRSRRSTASVVARIRYEAEEKLAALRKKELQIEAELIKKKLIADVATAEETSDPDDDEPSEQVEQRVRAWLSEQGPDNEETAKERVVPEEEGDAPKPEDIPPAGERREPQRLRFERPIQSRIRSPTPPAAGINGVEQLADTLDKLLNQRQPRHQTELPIFTGSPSEWLPFKAAMEDTTTFYKLKPIENLARLRSCLRGEAREAVAPLLSIATPPEQIMKTLEQCFGRPEVMVDRMMEDLKKLPRLGGSAAELNHFAVKIQNMVAILRKLKHGYLFNPLLVRDILEKLSPYEKSKWYDYAEETSHYRNEPDVVLLSEFLMREADRALRYGFTTAPALRKETSRPPPNKNEVRPRRPVFAISEEGRGKPSHSQPERMREEQTKCPICTDRHALFRCAAFKKLSVQKRWDTVKQEGLCFLCLSSRHRRYNCKAKQCGMQGCKRPHHPLLHEERSGGAPPIEDAVITASVASDRAVKLKMRRIQVVGPRGEADIFALFDEGSTVTLLDEDVAEAIGADGPPKMLRMHGINAERREERSRLVQLGVRGRDGTRHDITARTVNGLNLLTQSVPESLLQLAHLRDLKNEEICYENEKPQLLIGTDNWQLIVSRELRIGKRNQPAASKTKLGWVIHGSIPKRIIRQDENEDILHISTVETRNDRLEEMVKKHFDIDALGIAAKAKLSNEEQRAIDLFGRTAKRTEDGRFEVGLLWRKDGVKLPLSYNNALRRLKNLERKLDRNPQDALQYHGQMVNLIRKGYAEKCDGTEAGSENTWYLPHFPVKNPNKPGKLRLVFDAAAKTNGVSLNDNLLEGPDLLTSLPRILFRFREEVVAVKADIEEMFLRVKIRREDQPAQMFLWREGREEPPSKYKMVVMIFGASCSPYLAHSVRNRNAEEHAVSCPEAYRAITEAHYMDDYVDSYPDYEKAKQVVEQVDRVHKMGGFHLRGWTSNDRRALTGLPVDRLADDVVQPVTKGEQKTLGILWDSRGDTLKFNTSLSRVPKEVRELQRAPTKREALSTVMSIYDPLGLLSCYTITAKVILQGLWRQKLDWDEPLPAESAEDFTRWLRDMEHISHLELPRSYNGGSPTRNRQLHVFCDASKDAYAAAVYWRLEQEDGEIRVMLAAAKAKVAPLKTQTIPRLELQAALVGARLGNAVTAEHRWKTDAIFYWTDAQVVLWWIQNGSRKYTPYVAHRLGEIAELTSVHQWRWVSTKNNIADMATRTGYVTKSEEDPWFNGPDFLRRPVNEWPTESPVQAEDLEEHVAFQTTEASEVDCLPDVSRFSKYERLVRCTAMVLLFIEKCRDRRASLDVRHLEKAEVLWYRKSQHDSFAREIEKMKNGGTAPRWSSLYRLNPVYRDGLLTLDGRIRAAQVPDEMKNPVILDGRHPFTRLLVARVHARAGHGSRERVVNDLRQKFWILKLRPTVRSIIHNCAFCRMRRARPKIPQPRDLPPERLGAFQRPFSYCGLDCFGPMIVTIGRRHEKRWGALFTCLTTRAVHLELVATLSTDSALMAMRRMAARRGWPAVMYSDIGTNFRGADVELQRAYAEWVPAMTELGLTHRMQWKFTPPGAPNQGGAWERLVRSVKTALLTTLNEKSPKEEVLQTLMTEAEYSVNARPLVHVSVDPDDPEAITPNHFLIGSSTGQPYVGPCELADKKTWRVAQALADEFWRRWVREYLPTLTPRGGAPRSGRNLAPGDLVIVVDPTLPRNTWPRGVVHRVYPGPDGRVRCADVRTRSGVFRRPTSKLAVIEESPPEEPAGSCSAGQSAAGRVSPQSPERVATVSASSCSAGQSAAGLVSPQSPERVATGLTSSCSAGQSAAGLVSPQSPDRDVTSSTSSCSAGQPPARPASLQSTMDSASPQSPEKAA
ncbi:uncharacterized protein LOC121739697 [Aricia agestis]|uniref:uncharacterized protein LOC121739697 n=1 Tax=Aricia agestis TaxID=91739 RepID=UPI001C20A1F9|nr:uncharacterized protein LOC121739697 [Aricia agestis]